MADSKYFFIPHIGKNHNGRLILLATTGCCHSDCPRYRQCTSGDQEDWSDCPYRDKDKDGQYILLSHTVPHMVEKFINDNFEDEKRYKTFACLTNAISLSLGRDKLQRWEKEKIRSIWDLFIITELCQHFIGCTNDAFYKDRNSVETKYGDFEKSKSFEKLLSLIKALDKEGIIISKIMILGSPAFKYIKECCDRKKIPFIPLCSKDGYWHTLYLNGRPIEILYTWHPSYSRYYDKMGNISQLIPELTKFFT